MIGFKLYCAKTFDIDIEFYNRANLNDAEALSAPSGHISKRAADRLFARFGHPALYRPLPTPMVHARAADALKHLYRGRLGSTDMHGDYSDIAMQSMSTSQPGKSSAGAAPFEVVNENQMDFSYFKDRPDFRDEFGGGIYGRPDDTISERSHTPRPFAMEGSPGSSRDSSPTSSLRGRKPLEVVDMTAYGPPSSGNSAAFYNQLHTRRPSDAEHPAFRPPMGNPTPPPLYRHRTNESATQQLLNNAQSPPAPFTPGGTRHRSGSGSDRENGSEIVTLDRWRTGGYGPLSQDDPPETSYDYFRGRR